VEVLIKNRIILKNNSIPPFLFSLNSPRDTWV
jgi:hypothetical protein